MKLFYINKYGIRDDIAGHIRNNRKWYIFGIMLLIACVYFGIRAGIKALNPHTALAHYNASYYNLVIVIGRDKYIYWLILNNILSLFLLYFAMFHYYTTPLCLVVLIQRIFNFAVTVTLVFRLFGFGAVFVSLFGLVPFFLLTLALYYNFCIYLYHCAQYCYRYENSSFIIFEFRKMWQRLMIYVLILVLLSVLGGVLTILFTSSVI